MRGLADHGEGGVSGGESSRAGKRPNCSIRFRSEIVVIIDNIYD